MGRFTSGAGRIEGIHPESAPVQRAAGQLSHWHHQIATIVHPAVSRQPTHVHTTVSQEENKEDDLDCLPVQVLKIDHSTLPSQREISIPHLECYTFGQAFLTISRDNHNG